MIGREAEARAVRELLDEPSRAGVLLTGEPGVGKTYLAEHIVASAEANGIPVRRLYANRMTGELPLGLLAAGFTADDTFTDVAPTLSVKRALAEHPTPPLILVDDIDALDSSSASILVGATDAGLAKLIVTLRSGSIAAPAIEHALTVGAFAQHVCRNLDGDDTVRLAEQLSGAELAVSTQRRVVELTGGNPLYVRELIAAAIEADQLVTAAGGAVLTGFPVETPRLADLVKRRLANLEPGDLDALRYIVAAGSVSQGVIRSFVPPESIQRLDRLGVIVTTLDGRRL